MWRILLACPFLFLLAESVFRSSRLELRAQETVATRPPIHLWFEPEWFDGVKGSFAYHPGTAKPTGSWGIAGPGISP